MYAEFVACVLTSRATLLAEDSCSHAAAAGRRLTAEEYLQHYGPQLFPHYFGRLLHPFLGGLATLEPDARVAAIEAEFDRLTLVGTQGMPHVVLSEVTRLCGSLEDAQ